MGVLSVKEINSKTLTNNQKIGLKYYKDLKKIKRKEAENVKKILEEEFKKIDKKGKIILAGSYYRGKKLLGDIDIILVSDKNNLKDFINILKNKNIIISSFGKNIKNNYSGLVKVNNIVRHIDIHMVKEKYLPFHMLYFSSGELYSRKIRKIAKEKGYKLNEKGLYKNNKRLNITINELYKLLNFN